MEFWLLQDNEKIQLPVPPSEYTIKKGNNNSTVVVEDIGEINLIGRSKLGETSVSSFFPAQRYYFCQCEPKKPLEYVELIEKWLTSNKPIRYIITNTNVNELFTIEDFEYGEKDGTGDLYFTLTLKEYKIIQEERL
ncbi:hypothetical protein HGI79_05090 [Clostridium sp. DJ247]|nr:hypothetical protein [Clostridium sp. DJ247]